MIEPLVVEFDVEAAPRDAFAIWTERTAVWWPKDHTMSGDPAAIRFEGRVGGRIFEVAADGAEHDWGEIVEWDPPFRVRYLWHLFFDRVEATEVELSFLSSGRSATTVRLVQTGWERLGDQAEVRRERNFRGWSAVTTPYRALFDHR